MKRRCPNGHAVSAQQAYCGTCGAEVPQADGVESTTSKRRGALLPAVLGIAVVVLIGIIAVLAIFLLRGDDEVGSAESGPAPSTGQTREEIVDDLTAETGCTPVERSPKTYDPLVAEQWNCGRSTSALGSEDSLGFILFFDSNNARDAYVTKDLASPSEYENGIAQGTSGDTPWVVHSYDDSYLAKVVAYGGEMVRPVAPYYQ